jgi:hypothetical protein
VAFWIVDLAFLANEGVSEEFEAYIFRTVKCKVWKGKGYIFRFQRKGSLR